MSKCLEPEILQQLAAGTLDEQLIDPTIKHIEQCRRCARALDEVTLDADLIQSLIEAESMRQQLKPDMDRLKSLEGRVTTTLFGPD